MLMKAKDIKFSMFTCPGGHNGPALFVYIKHECISFFL